MLMSNSSSFSLSEQKRWWRAVDKKLFIKIHLHMPSLINKIKHLPKMAKAMLGSDKHIDYLLLVKLL